MTEKPDFIQTTFDQLLPSSSPDAIVETESIENVDPEVYLSGTTVTNLEVAKNNFQKQFSTAILVEHLTTAN